MLCRLRWHHETVQHCASLITRDANSLKRRDDGMFVARQHLYFDDDDEDVMEEIMKPERATKRQLKIDLAKLFNACK